MGGVVFYAGILFALVENPQGFWFPASLLSDIDRKINSVY